MPSVILTRDKLKKIIGRECLALVKDNVEIPESISLPDSGELREVAKMLKMLSSEPKLEILAILSQVSLPVCAIAKIVNKEQSLVSHHLSELRMLGFVNEKRYGKFKVYSVDSDVLNEICSRMQKILFGEKGAH